MLGISKGKHYYIPKGEDDTELKIMKSIDEKFTEDQTLGVIRMTELLKLEEFKVGYRKIRRLMRKMGIWATFPKPNLSKLGLAKYIHSYKLRKLDINHPNQVWSVDITYIPMAKGFMYLTAIIDVYSRTIVVWGLHNTLEAANNIEVLLEAIKTHGKPEIINSDQGSQYTSKEWVNTLKDNNIEVSMNGRGRCLDNIWIERLNATHFTFSHSA